MYSLIRREMLDYSRQIYLQMGLHVQDSDAGTEPMETPVDDCEERSKEYKQEPTKTMNHYMQRGGQSWTITIKR